MELVDNVISVQFLVQIRSDNIGLSRRKLLASLLIRLFLLRRELFPVFQVLPKKTRLFCDYDRAV